MVLYSFSTSPNFSIILKPEAGSLKSLLASHREIITFIIINCLIYSIIIAITVHFMMNATFSIRVKYVDQMSHLPVCYHSSEQTDKLKKKTFLSLKPQQPTFK